MSPFIFANKTDPTKSATTIDCVHIVRDADEFAYVIAPQTAIEEPNRLLGMPTKVSPHRLSAPMLYALSLAHGRSVGTYKMPVGRVRRPHANDVDVMYLDDFDEWVRGCSV